jgi:hypothetical protein
LIPKGGPGAPRTGIRMNDNSRFNVRFEIAAEERFSALTRAYDRVRKCKTEKDWPENNESWTPFFDSKALRHFWWPTPVELKEWKKLYFSTHYSKRASAPRLQHPWDFMSMFEAFKNGDYELLPIARLSDAEAFLSFSPFGDPYGGTGCMRALIESFDHRVTTVSE